MRFDTPLSACSPLRAPLLPAGSLRSFSANLVVPSDQVVITGHTKTFTATGSSGNPVHREFCPECGSPIRTLASTAPNMAFVKAGECRWRSALGFARQMHPPERAVAYFGMVEAYASDRFWSLPGLFPPGSLPKPAVEVFRKNAEAWQAPLEGVKQVAEQ